MSANIKQLIENLESCQRVYHQLLPLLKAERRAAYRSKPDQFAAIVAEKEAFLAQLGQLARERQFILTQISTAYGIPMQGLRLSVLARQAGEPLSSELLRLGASLDELLGNVRRTNEENRGLIQHCLEIVQNNLGFFQQWTMPKDVYGASGQMSLHKRNGNLISGAV